MLSKSKLIQTICVTIVIPSLFILNACTADEKNISVLPKPSTELPSPSTTNPEPLIEKPTIEEEDAISNIITGSYTIDNPTPLNSGVANITYKGDGIYHLSVDVSRGFSFNQGNIEADFEIQENTPMLIGEEYERITLSFDENKLIIDYPNDLSFGGMNAEPKGTYYLNNENENNKFINNLYKYANISNDKDDKIIVVAEHSDTELILIQKHINDEVTDSYIILYDATQKSFVYQNKIEILTYHDIKEKLQEYEFNDYQIYFAINRVYYDRYMSVLVERFNNGGQRNKILTDEECFYIATGLENDTSYYYNARDKNNIGSIFIHEIDSSNDKEAVIHLYELVRNDEDDEHTATIDWITVNKETGMVSTIIDP